MSAPINSNTPAFPSDIFKHASEQGMPLRAWLAGQALAGLLANPALVKSSTIAIAQIAIEQANDAITELAKSIPLPPDNDPEKEMRIADIAEVQHQWIFNGSGTSLAEWLYYSGFRRDIPEAK